MGRAADSRKRTKRIHRGVRLGIQILFFILAPAFFSAAFNGVKYVFGQLGASAPIEMTAFLLMLVVILAFTVVAGRFFCGFACAFGTLGDILFMVFDALRSKTPIPRLVFPDKLVKALSLLKYLILIIICVMCFFGVWQTVSGYSPWVSFAGIIAGSVDGIAVGAFITLGLVVVLMILRERAFCQFLCPLGALFALMPVLGFSKYIRDASACIPNCGRCKKHCPVDIWPDDTFVEGECISCGRCADVCPISNVNLVAIEKSVDAELSKVSSENKKDAKDSKTPSVRKSREKWHLISGTEVVTMLVKAVILLFIFWVLGATRFLPPFAEIAYAISGM